MMELNILFVLLMQKHSISAFIDKSWNMLSSASHSEVVSWTEDGNSFRVIDEGTFEHEVLPIYFKHANLTSFQRQLNMYNFHKKKTPEGHMEYHHKLFKRDQRDLLKAIRRKPSEDEIQIGEELLRKLRQEHQQTHHEPIQIQSSIEGDAIKQEDQAPVAHPLPLLQPTLLPQPSLLQPVSPFVNDLYPQPVYYYYFPQEYPRDYQLPVPVVYPQKIVDNYILISNNSGCLSPA